MTTERLAPPTYRHLAARARLLGMGDEDSLQNVNTTSLNDGALCYVTEFASYFMLDKVSTATPEGNVIIQPANGPGRWIFLIAPAADSALWAEYAANTGPLALTGLTQSEWVNPPAPGGAIYNFSAPGPDLWDLDVATGIITYNGVDGKEFEITVNASIASGTGTAASIEVTAGLTGLVDTTTDDIYAQRAMTVATAGAEVQISMSRILTTLLNGDEIRPLFRNLSGATDLSIERLSVVITSLD